MSIVIPKTIVSARSFERDKVSSQQIRFGLHGVLQVYTDWFRFFIEFSQSVGWTSFQVYFVSIVNNFQMKDLCEWYKTKNWMHSGHAFPQNKITPWNLAFLFHSASPMEQSGFHLAIILFCDNAQMNCTQYLYIIW